MATVTNMVSMSKIGQVLNHWQQLIRVVRRIGRPRKNPLQLFVVSDGSLTAVAEGVVISWWPLMIEIRIDGRTELDYLERVRTSQTARENWAGVVWSAQQTINYCDELITYIVQDIMDQQNSWALRLDSSMLVVALVGLAVIPFNPTIGVMVVMTSMLVGRIAGLIAMVRRRRLTGMLTRLAETRERRIDLVCLRPISYQILRVIK